MPDHKCFRKKIMWILFRQCLNFLSFVPRMPVKWKHDVIKSSQFKVSLLGTIKVKTFFLKLLKFWCQNRATRE